LGADRGPADDIYRAHAACTCILLIRQDGAEMVLQAGDQLALPAFGLFCPVRDVYRRTPLS
jgi:hypothetical protein